MLLCLSGDQGEQTKQPVMSKKENKHRQGITEGMHHLQEVDHFPKMRAARFQLQAG